MTDDKSVSDSELYAYLDEQLDEKQRSEIEKKMKHDVGARKKLVSYQKMNQTLHAIYDPVLQEDVPGRLMSVPARRSSYGSIAASTIFFLLGSFFGWQMQLNLAFVQPGNTSTTINLVQPAVFAHSIFAVEVAHPVEVSAAQHQHLNQWLSKRLKTTLNAPDLSDSGYQLIGGRLLPSTEDRMAAQYMYEDSKGSRISLYVRRGHWDRDNTAFNYSQQKGYSMFYWIDNDLGYALTSELDKALHQNLAKEVYKQMSLNSVKI